MQETVENNDNKFMKTLGEIIKSHRKSLDKSIYLISAEASIPKSTWREIELGLCRDIRLSTLWKVAEGLDIDIVDLIKELKQHLGSDFTLSDFD